MAQILTSDLYIVAHTEEMMTRIFPVVESNFSP